MAWRKLCLLTVLAVMGVLNAETLIDAPQKLKLERATYHKITIKWDYPETETQIAGFRIYRDGKKISRSNETVFTDTDVIPGKYYEYNVDAVTIGGKSSVLSAPLKVKTFDSVDFSQHEQVERIVDSIHDMSTKNLTVLSLFSAIKAGFESLTGSSLAMNTFDTELISQMISSELEVIKTAVPDLTDAERIAAQAELDTLMKESFGGHSIEQLFIYERLTNLAEKHWEKGHKQAASILYNFSLNFLSDQENCVLSTLNRLAIFNTAHLTSDTNTDDVESSLAASASEMLRFFDFFPDSKSNSAKFIYSYLSGQYFKHFSKLLSYDDYREQAFLAARSYAIKQQELSGKVSNNSRLEQIEAWQLIRVKVRLHDSNGNPRHGLIKVANVTAETKPAIFPDEPYYEERTFEINGEAEIPVYAGHIYEITANIPILGGNDLIMNLSSFPQQNDQQIVYDTHGNPVQSPSSNGPMAEIIVADSNFPYNLKFERDIDVFTLNWDWVDSANFKAAGFKVFNGDKLVATVNGSLAANIRLNSPDGNYTYTVAAFDANGKLSRFSVPVTIEPGDQSAYSEFFAWLKEYFGDLPVLSTDDFDGDGVDNYHEYLNGTDPTCAPAPTPFDKQVTYTKITLNWEYKSDPGENVIWTIRRNGTEVGTSLTTSFTDSGLIPGMEYRYTIRGEFANGIRTDWSSPLQLKTQKAETNSYGDKLQQVVDFFNPINLAYYTAPSLISAVKSAVEAVTGSNITFTVINESLLEKLVETEFELLRESTGSMTAAERLTLRTELSQMMEESFGGNSFEHMYIQGKLAELAESHWAIYLADHSNTVSRTAAEALYDASLGFMKDHQPTVFGTLSRLAMMQLQALESDSSLEDIKAALTRQRDILLRFFEFFEDFDFEIIGALHPYIAILNNYYRYFPTMLAYEHYDYEIFNSAMQIRNALAEIETKFSTSSLLKKVSAWNLVPLTISCKTIGTNTGTLTFKNVSKRLNSSLVDEEYKDIRTVQLADGELELPVYGGHWYELELVTPVNGGPDWKRIIGPLFLPAGEKVIYDSFTGVSRETLPGGTVGATLALKLEQPLAPYNLKAEKLPDALNLSWDWAVPGGFTLDHFKVYRGDTVVGVSTTQMLAGIPRVVKDDAAYAYSVTAVSTSGAETRHSPAIQVLPDFTEEEKAYFEWKYRYFGDVPTLATDDSDGDGLSNYHEFLLGSNPLVAPPETDKELNIRKLPGSIVKYYNGIWNKIPDFYSLTPYKQEIKDRYCFNSKGEILGSEKEDTIGLTIDGYFDITQNGIYQFVLSSDEGSRLLIDGKEIVKNDHMGSTLEYFASTKLNVGSHSYRIEYFEQYNDARLRLYWSGPGFTRVPFEENRHWHTNGTNAEFEEYILWNKDSDGDGLLDADELKCGTDRFKADSDGDGISDGDEVNKYHTNPLNQDSDNDGIPDNEMLKLFDPDDKSTKPFGLESVLKINPAEFISSTGIWKILQKRYVMSDDTRGSLIYNVNVPEANIYRLHVTFSQFFPEAREVKLHAYLDGIKIGNFSLEMKAENAELTAYTPWISAGKHTLKLFWNGHRREVILRITGIELQKINGPDNDKNGKADWIDAYLKKNETVKLPETSPVSPVNIAGTSKYTDLIRVNGIADSILASEGDWFADIQIDPMKSTPIEVSFQNGGQTVLGSVKWSETNLILENGKTITIRKNDALKLNVCPDKTDDGKWQIRGMGSEWSGDVSKPKILKFETVGEYFIEGEYFNMKQQSAGKGCVTVKVVDYSFSDSEPALWVDRLRSWDISALPEGVTLVPSKSITLFEQASVLTSNQFRYRIGVNTDKDSGVLAKLKNGSVLALAKMKPFYLYSSNETYVAQAEGYDDGTGLYEMPLIASPVLPDTEIRLRIFVAGVLFDNGTTEMRLHPEDFDERGMAKVYFLKHPEATSSVCHTLQVYQNNIYVGIRH